MDSSYFSGRTRWAEIGTVPFSILCVLCVSFIPRQLRADLDGRSFFPVINKNSDHSENLKFARIPAKKNEAKASFAPRDGYALRIPFF
jgi:hypothetical protein